MTDLKCPFCPEVRPSRGRLQQHVDGMHYMQHNKDTRHEAVSRARTVEDVKVVELSPLHVREHEGCTGPDCKLTCCTCNKGPVTYFNYRGYPLCATCTEGDNDKPTAKIDPNRDILAEGLTLMNEKLSEAGGQMSKMKAALDAVDEKMRALDAQLISPPVIRHATLNEVWDRLMAAGNITGAITVMDMIREGNAK